MEEQRRIGARRGSRCHLGSPDYREIEAEELVMVALGV